jgi:dipeptidase D
MIMCQRLTWWIFWVTDEDMSVPTNSAAIRALEPMPVWRLFADISAVPRPSKREDRIRRHVRRVAEENGLKARQDGAGNLLIEVPPSPGCAAAPTTVLQGHLDMVCEKNAGTTHDFEHEPIRLLVESDPQDGQQIIRADGTTLGADNGIGVALALAAAFSPEVVHGPLELLFTFDEEAGMTGAKALSPDFFRGRRMLNLDSEEDDSLYIGCAGGCDTSLTWVFRVRSAAQRAELCRVTVAGLCGGHSGGDIHKHRGNAIKLLTRTLLAGGGDKLRLAEFNGGSKHNAIPREAAAVVAGPRGTREALQRAAVLVREQAARESAEDHPDIVVEPTASKSVPAVLSAADTARLLEVLAALPHGVLSMHPQIGGLVETSNNVATIATRLDDGGPSLHVAVGTLSRSSSATQLHVTLRQIEAVGRLAGGNVTTSNEYPGWAPNVNSPVLASCRKVYEALFGAPPKVTAIHAGLECGIIGDRVGGMDAVSFGPRITGAHSPDERVYVASVQKVWKYLRAVLGELAKG